MHLSWNIPHSNTETAETQKHHRVAVADKTDCLFSGI